MIIRRLRNKLLLSALSIGIVVTMAAMLAVSWVISQQYHEQADALLGKASQTISDSLDQLKSNQLAASRQLATQKNLGSTIWYLAKYAKSNVDREMLFVTYQKLAMDAHRIGHVANLSKVAIYDATGSLVSFALIDKGDERVGFAEHAPAPRYSVASLKMGEQINRMNIKSMDTIDRMEPRLDGPLAQKESVQYAQVEGELALESLVPIMGEVFDPATGKQTARQVGLVVTVMPLTQDYVAHLSRLTDTKINIFTPQGISSGSVPAYQKPDWRGLPQAAENASKPIARFNEITIAGEDFYQSLIPLNNDAQRVGTVSALHSKSIVTSRIWEMLKILMAIAASSMLLIFPIAWYFATSISRPLTTLSDIFKEVASGKRGERLTQLEHVKQRADELGDLTQSFIAMNEAINQKIQQIEDINSSLEQTISERTAALAASEQESRTLLQNTPDTIARYDRELHRTYANAALAAATEGGLTALLGKRPSECPGGPNAVIYETMINKVMLTGEDCQFELKWMSKYGKEICSHIRLAAEHDLSGNVISVLAVGRDITELNDFRTELQRKELAKTRFLAAASHDLRQPLAAANLFIDALQHSGTTPDQSKIIHRLTLAMTTFNGLLDSLLNVSKLDAGVIKPDYSSINIIDIFTWLEQSFAPMALDKGIGFKLYFPMKGELIVHSDIDLIKSVLMNFVSNAIKFTSRGGILISARRRNTDVLFQVWDTGIGIADEYIGHIFDEFYQIGNPQRDRTKGLGLGLSIAKRAVSLLGSQVVCHSRVGHGTVMEFRLPLSAPQDAQAELYKTKQVDDEQVNLFSFVHGKRFVVLEDDVLVSDALSQLLKELGGEVLSFYCVEEALIHPAIEQADCYIVDYMLEGKLNGIQFLNQLRQKKNGPLVAVLMTGDTSPSFIRESSESEWPVLHKPANIAKLIASLNKQSLKC